MRKIISRVERVSRAIHNRIYKDYDQSLCARAWLFKGSYAFWKVWTYVFTRRHCRNAYNKWRKW